MDFTDVTWTQFKEVISKQIAYNRKFIYRGQSNSNWPLKTSVHRTGQANKVEDVEFYFDQIVPIAYQAVAAWEGRVRNLSDRFELAQFLAYMQHHGFPTPLLDWTYSPYIAAFFAFDGIDHFNPTYDYICMYSFDKEAWLAKFKQSYDYRDKNLHISILEPSFIGNPKQLIQQGLYMYTNLVDIEGHVEVNQKTQQEPFMMKYRIASKERPQVMRELQLMNITAMQLFPSLESVCEKVATDISLFYPMGKTPGEVNNADLLEQLLRYRNTMK